MILADQGALGGDTFSLILPIAMILLLGIVLWRGNRQRKQQQEQMKTQRVVGAQVLTQSGIYGTIVDIDDEKNVVTIESTPGTRIRVHSMTIATVVEEQPTPVTPANDEADHVEDLDVHPRTDATTDASAASTTLDAEDGSHAADPDASTR